VTRVTFGEFYDACKGELTESLLKALEAKHEYFRFDAGGYCGLDIPDGESIWISIFVGGMRDLWEFRRFVMKCSVTRVGFAYKPGSVTATLAKYYEAQAKVSQETYSDGGTRIDCVIYPQQTQRAKLSVPLETPIQYNGGN
jgi:hypothetical protein